MPSLAETRLRKQYMMIQKNPVSNVIVRPKANNIFLWHFCLYGLQDPYKGGFYHGIIEMPKQYPLKPPSLKFYTPNGRFKTNTKICMSFTSYHPETWSASLTVDKMLMGLISFMYQNQRTTGQIITTNSDKRKITFESIRYNLQNPEFIQLFQDYFQQISFPTKAPDIPIQPQNSSQQNNQKMILPTVATILIVLYISMKVMNWL